MTDRILIGVDLACNDDQGNFAGTVDMVTVGDLLQLEGDALICSNPAYQQVEIDRLALWSHGYIPWHGNMAWDAIRLTLADTARLIERLRANHWTVLEADARLFAAYDDGQPITAELLEECL